jgi:proteasome accessory factor C
VEAAVGRADPAEVVVGMRGREGEGIAETRAVLTEVLARRRACAIRYYTPSRDEITERVVDPMRLLIVDGRGYLEAWCRTADAVRLFRLDRIDDVRIRDEPSAPPAHAVSTDTSEGFYRPRPDQRTAVLRLRPSGRWIAEYYRVEDVEELPGGQARVRLRYDDDSWLVRLALGSGGDAVVEQPVEVVAEIRRRADVALRRSGRPPVAAEG